MNLKDSTLHTTQNYIDALITEQWFIFHLDHLDNKHYVNQSAGMHHIPRFIARELAHSTTFYTSAQLPMRRSELKSQLWARRNSRFAWEIGVVGKTQKVRDTSRRGQSGRR